MARTAGATNVQVTLQDSAQHTKTRTDFDHWQQAVILVADFLERLGLAGKWRLVPGRQVTWAGRIVNAMNNTPIRMGALGSYCVELDCRPVGIKGGGSLAWCYRLFPPKGVEARTTYELMRCALERGLGATFDADVLARAKTTYSQAPLFYPPLPPPTAEELPAREAPAVLVDEFDESQSESEVSVPENTPAAPAAAAPFNWEKLEASTDIGNLLNGLTRLKQIASRGYEAKRQCAALDGERDKIVQAKIKAQAEQAKLLERQVELESEVKLYDEEIAKLREQQAALIATVEGDPEVAKAVEMLAMFSQLSSSGMFPGAGN